MPPHPQLALVQALLVRSLVAMFWEQPLTAPLVRWGTRLHEDFLLPQGASPTSARSSPTCAPTASRSRRPGSTPFTEFRFPRIGMTRLGGRATGIELELRQAVEPWHVLGEEATAGGTARYVDSSVERLQVTVRGIDPARTS